MEIRLVCKQCQQRYRVSSDAQGSYLKCKKCGVFIEISPMKGESHAVAGNESVAHQTPIIEPEIYEEEVAGPAPMPERAAPTAKRTSGPIKGSENEQSAAVAAWFDMKNKSKSRKKR